MQLITIKYSNRLAVLMDTYNNGPSFIPLEKLLVETHSSYWEHLSLILPQMLQYVYME